MLFRSAHAAGLAAIISENEKGQTQQLSWPELKRQTAALALHLQAQGVQPGDRVAAYLPNITQAAIAMLACMSIGAIWSMCAPDMGTHAVLDRFQQIEPKVLIACDGVTYGGKDHDRLQVVQALRDGLPTLQHVILCRNLNADATLSNSENLDTILEQSSDQINSFEPLWLPFDHPLWIVYSSGTTGLPKPIVHGHEIGRAHV